MQWLSHAAYIYLSPNKGCAERPSHCGQSQQHKSRLSVRFVRFPPGRRVIRARILKHFKVTAENITLGKVNFSNGILKQPDFSVTAVCHCGQETCYFATGLNAAVLVTLLERQLVCLRIPKMQVWLVRYLFKRKVIFSTSIKCLRIRALERSSTLTQPFLLRGRFRVSAVG
jgi:hypothetical protein